MIPTLAAWLHDLDPYAIRLWEGGPIRWYGLSYLLGFFLGYLLIKRVARVGVSTLRPEHVGDLIVTLAVGIVAGGRLGYCIFYQPSYLITFREDFPWWMVLAINEGGMASHGGIAGGIVAAWYFAWRHRHDLPFLIDLFAFGAPLGLFFGRIANFVNGELFGRGPTDVPWAVKFPQEMLDWDTDRLAVVYREVAALPDARPHLDSYGEMLAFVMEAVQGGNRQVIAAVEPLLTPRHPSQLYAAVAEGLVVMAVLLWVWRKPRLPGIVGSWFALSYATMRISDEFFRRPDAHIADAEFALLGVTRGQWLSLILLGVGVWGLWYSHYHAKKKGLPKMGSWRRGPWTTEAAPASAPANQPAQS